jgi:hypothetical protein
MSATKHRTVLVPAERFELAGMRVYSLTYQAPRGEVTHETWVTLRTARSEFIMSATVGSMAVLANKADDLNLWKKA